MTRDEFDYDVFMRYWIDLLDWYGFIMLFIVDVIGGLVFLFGVWVFFDELRVWI